MRHYIFPAYAGVIRCHSSSEKNDVDFPRVCGGDPLKWNPCRRCSPFSPRMRG